MKRYNINENYVFNSPDSSRATLMQEQQDGEYVKFADMVVLLQTIGKSDPDLSPLAAVIDAIFDTFGEVPPQSQTSRTIMF